MVKINQFHCDENALKLLVQGELTNEQAEEVQRHLDECNACAKHLESLSTASWSWDEVAGSLPADEFDSPDEAGSFSMFGFEATNQKTQDDCGMLSREISGWLDATDDPRMLGRFAGYEIVGIIGHGGMGIVLKGFESSLNRYVAIKVLAPRLATNGTARKRFAREARAAAAVLHENVIAIHRVDEWHGLPFLVMPYSGGVSLQRRIDDDGPLNIEATLRVGLQIAAGLAAAHEQGLVHRDIKPANILLDQGVERVTITDFGLARAADDMSMTLPGIIAGTPQYMSPEQAEARAIDSRSDLFSLGSVLYTMATGQPPFRGDGNAEVLRRVAIEPAKSLREIDATIPVWFENLVVRLHEKSASDRPKSAAEVQRLLNACLLHLTRPGQSLPTELTRHATPLPRRGWWIAGAFGLSVAVLFSFLLPLLQPTPDEDKASPASTQIRRTVTESMVQIKGEMETEQEIMLQIEESRHNRPLMWTMDAKGGPFTATVTREPVPAGDGTTLPGFTFRLLHDESGTGGVANIACTDKDPLPGATIRFDPLKPQENELSLQHWEDPLRVATIQYPDGTQAAVSLVVRVRGKHIATVLSKSIYEGDFRKHLSAKDNLIRLIFDPLMKHYCKEQGIDRAALLKARVKNEQSRLGAEIFVLRAELNRHLYAKYGGRVVLSAFGPVAVDAQKKWIAALEQTGDLSITDPQLRSQLDKLLTLDEGTLFASPDQIKEAFDPALTEKLIENAAKMPVGAQLRRNYKLVGEVFGKPIRLHQRYLDNTAELPDLLKYLIVTPLEEHYRKQHPEFEPTVTEIDALSVITRRNGVAAIAVYRRSLAEVEAKLRHAEKGTDLYGNLEKEKAVIEYKLKRMEGNDGRADATRIASLIKFQKHLYDMYGGGRALTGQLLIAFDAQRKWVEEREKLGEFQIADPALRTRFYDNWTKGTELHGANLINDPVKSAAQFNAPWLDQPIAANQPMRKDNPNSRVGQTIAIEREQTVAGRSPSSIRFPTKEVSEQIERLKKEDDVATVVTELRRITGLDFGDGVHRDSRIAWLAWLSQEQDNASKAADGVRNYIVIGKVTDPEGQAVPAARVRIEVPLAASSTGTYRLAQTLSDHDGKYVLAFGRLKSTSDGDAALEATFTAMKPPSHEQKPDEKKKRVLASAVHDETNTKPESNDADAPIYPGRPVEMNFILHPAQ